jgi:hypothetical protein
MIRLKSQWHTQWVEESATKSQPRLHLDGRNAVAQFAGAVRIAPHNAVPPDHLFFRRTRVSRET